MSIQRLHAFEKTSIQARHTLKRLEVLMDSTHSTDEEKAIAADLVEAFKTVRKLIPEHYQDVDLNTKE